MLTTQQHPHGVEKNRHKQGIEHTIQIISIICNIMLIIKQQAMHRKNNATMQQMHRKNNITIQQNSDIIIKQQDTIAHIANKHKQHTNMHKHAKQQNVKHD
jgi:hypothetical protein